MGCPTKVQVIRRERNEQWYVNLPFAIAQAMDFEKGEEVEWHIESKGLLALERRSPPPALLKKKRRG
jgi:antitoxin component of MazEF toxin-antitoxin module